MVNNDRSTLSAQTFTIDIEDFSDFVLEPAVAVDASGNIHIVWSSSEITELGKTPTRRIHYVRVDKTGSITAGPLKFDTVYKLASEHDYTSDARVPSIAVDGSGNAYVVWQQWRSSGNRIHLGVVKVDGTIPRGTAHPSLQQYTDTGITGHDPVLKIDNDMAKLVYRRDTGETELLGDVAVNKFDILMTEFHVRDVPDIRSGKVIAKDKSEYQQDDVSSIIMQALGVSPHVVTDSFGVTHEIFMERIRSLGYPLKERLYYRQKNINGFLTVQGSIPFEFTRE